MVRLAKLGSRDLCERLEAGASARTRTGLPRPGVGSPLKIDEAAGVIYRVKVLGRYSRNKHGMEEAENGTEYSPECMRKNLSEYEERKVKTNHPPDRNNPGKERPVEDTFGILRNARIESDENGDPAIWADLHCLTTHDMYPRVVEDVKKRLGVFGLSHNASAARERFDRGTRRLVIEELSQVRSVDLVDKPATNRNLWESWESERRPMTKTLRQLLEGLLPKWKTGRQAWARHLLEDDAMAPMAEAPAEMEDGAEPEDALWTGFWAAIEKIGEKYKSGELDARAAGKHVTDYLRTHEKLAGGDEPEEATTDDVEEAIENDDDKDKPKDNGDKDKQESEELAQLRGERKARQLCESLEFTPTQLQIEAIAGIRDTKRQRELAESFRGAKTAGGYKTPKSNPPGGAKKPDPKKGRDTPESEGEVNAENAMRTLMGD